MQIINSIQQILKKENLEPIIIQLVSAYTPPIAYIPRHTRSFSSDVLWQQQLGMFILLQIFVPGTGYKTQRSR